MIILWDAPSLTLSETGSVDSGRTKGIKIGDFYNSEIIGASEFELFENSLPYLKIFSKHYRTNE